MTTDTQSETMLSHHLQAVLSNNLDEILADYDDDAYMLTPDGPVIGKEGVRAFFADPARRISHEFVQKFRMVRREARKDLGYFVWEAPGMVALGTDTFIIRDGKIVAQTVAMRLA